MPKRTFVPEVCEVNHVRLLLHTEVRWLSKGNCLRRLIELFEPLSEFLKDKSEMTLLMTTDDDKAYVSYLADIFEKLCSLNKQLQGADATLCDAKAKIFGFVRFRINRFGCKTKLKKGILICGIGSNFFDCLSRLLLNRACI